MKARNELISIIDLQIQKIDKYLNGLSIFDSKTISKNRQIIEENIANDVFNYLEQLNIKELTDILPERFNVELLVLNFYKSSLKTKYSITNTDIEKIREILSSINDYLTQLEIQNNTNKANLESCFQSRVEYSDLKDKIINFEGFLEKDLDMVFNLLSNVSDKDKAIDLLIAVGENALINDTNEVKIIEETEEFYENEDLDEMTEDLIKAFARFNLDFYSLSEQCRKKLILLGNITRIEGILTVLDEFDISLNDSYYGIKLIENESKNNQLLQILLYSDVPTMRKVLKCAKDNKLINDEILNDKGQLKTGIDFNLLLEAPARFIQKKRRYKRKGNQIIDINIKGEDFGAAQDFIDNMNLFVSLGVSAYEFCNNSSISIRSNETIRNTLSVFELYGIEKESYLSKLSCFNSNHQAESIDQFIELGQFDYLVKFMSRGLLRADDPLFYRLKYSLLYDDSNFRSKSGRFTDIIYKNGYGIGKTNGATVLKQYHPTGEINKMYQLYDYYLASDFNSDTSIIESIDKNVISLLDNNFLVRNQFGEMVYPNVYNFGSFITKRGTFDLNISRNKVLRLANTLLKHNVKIDDIDTIMYIVTKNSILNEEEFYLIYDAIKKAKEKVLS